MHQQALLFWGLLVGIPAYIAFNYLGQLVDIQGNPRSLPELIPLVQGNVYFARPPAPPKSPPTVAEKPIGNGTNAVTYNVVSIDSVTGRARVERMQVQ